MFITKQGQVYGMGRFEGGNHEDEKFSKISLPAGINDIKGYKKATTGEKCRLIVTTDDKVLY